jgi:peroxiredoxin
MKTALLMCSAIACFSSMAIAANDPKTVAEGTAIGQRVPQLAAEIIDVKGAKPRTAKFDSHKARRITAYVFVGTTCPATNAYVDRFKDLEHRYGPKGVDFIYIYPNGNDSHDTQIAFHKAKGFAGPLIDDHGAHLAQLFGAKRTTEIFVADKQGIIVYHGGVDDSREPRAITQHYLSTALDQLLARKPITTSTTDVFA